MTCNDPDYVALQQEEEQLIPHLFVTNLYLAFLDRRDSIPIAVNNFSDFLWTIFDSPWKCELVRSHVGPERWPEIEAKLARRRRVYLTEKQFLEEVEETGRQVEEEVERYIRLLEDPEFEKGTREKEEVILLALCHGEPEQCKL